MTEKPKDNAPLTRAVQEGLDIQATSCSEHPFVSVVICTCGFRKSLATAIESLLAQNCRRFEIVLVLNGNPDNAFEQAVNRYPVRLLNEPRRGVCVARNTAIPHALGEVLAFLDDDVEAHPGWLHETVKGFEDPQVACVTGRVVPEGPVYLDSERVQRLFLSPLVFSSWTLDSTDPDWFWRVLGDRVGAGCNMAFRRSFLLQHCLFPEDLGAGSVIGVADEDYMFLQVIKHGFGLRHQPNSVVTHHYDDNLAERRLRMAQLYSGSVAFMLKLFWEGNGHRILALKAVAVAVKRKVRRAISRTVSSEKQAELLSTSEKLRAYLKGPWIFLKSLRRRPITERDS